MNTSWVRWICRVAVFWCAGTVYGFAQTDFEKGEALFMENKPREALVYLENAIAGDPDPIPAYLYLGIVYEQLDRTGEALAVYLKILDRAGDLTATVAANLGNVYFKTGDTGSAERYYTLALEADPGYASACLGRANARVKAGSLKTAIDDYELYLALEPHSPKRAAIERLVAFIHTELAAGEQRKLPAGEAARVLEERRRLMDAVAAPVQPAVVEPVPAQSAVVEPEAEDGGELSPGAENPASGADEEAAHE